MSNHDDFDFEHSPGIPAPLPPGEHILWQGSPDRWEIAKSAFHIRKIAVYFALILIIQIASVMLTGNESPGASLPTTVLLSIAGLGILGTLAWLTARVTIYTVTNKRVLIRFGIALQITINLPFAQISAADMRVGKNGFGDLPLTLKDSRRVNYLVLWPHVRPWNFSRPQPMLRSIANVEHVAGIIGEAAQSSARASMQTQVVDTARTTSRSIPGAATDAVLMSSEVS